MKKQSVKKVKSLDFEDLKMEVLGMRMPDYVTRRMFGEVAKKINEIVDYLNKHDKKRISKSS